MRINRVDLAWFRGAADGVSLNANGKSVIVYGSNGAGKSSFVDALEYILQGGKIGHLSHEYSGRKQEKGVINTHAPALQPTVVALEFDGGAQLRADIRPNGSFTMAGDVASILDGWDYRRVVLRQDEVAAFIRSPKGEKYSALLPLLGLAPLEQSAENLRLLARQIERSTELVEKRIRHSAALAELKRRFGSIEEIPGFLISMHAKYSQGRKPFDNPAEECDVLRTAIAARINTLSEDARAHAALARLAAIPLATAIDAVDEAAAAYTAAGDNNLAERLEVLDRTLALASAESRPLSTPCPACGREIDASTLRAHVIAERERLKAERDLLQAYATARSVLADRVVSVQQALAESSNKEWSTRRNANHSAIEAILARVDGHGLRRTCSAENLSEFRAVLMPALQNAIADAATAPAEPTELIRDSNDVGIARQAIDSAELGKEVAQLTELIAWITATESAVRDRIRAQSDGIIDEISADVRQLWTILHPGEAIADVRLQHPADSEKAIDIELTFHGVEQKSPRLTLSEGYRNSLGLCVFLAMARRASKETPVILDDVVVSLDRDHRGMIAEVLEKEFADRQVIVFTHDRAWFVELRQRLEAARWKFLILRPYESPSVGISWATKSSTLDDARAYLASDPANAGNLARKIMDTELPGRAEKLRVRMLYRQSFANDHRMSHEFLESLLAASKIAFQEQGERGEYSEFTDAQAKLKSAMTLLSAWGNRASHTFDVVKPEAEKLISACEAALQVFDCSVCKKAVYRLADEAAEILQCGCGKLRWRYGKL